ncbi:MAG: YMGG-like glycine zipper-containing protein [Opitutaceae bacterium]|nr:YMGG-like glycine zipper-containing protein [Opitutaceae bacterium]
MKTILSACLVLLTATGGSAQVLRREAVNGALLGGVAGAVIGHNSGDLRHNGWKGAAIGAGAGLIAGEMIGHANATRRDSRVQPASYAAHGGYVYRHRPTVQVGYWGGQRGGYYGRDFGRHNYGYSSYRHRPSYSFGYYPGYASDYYPYYGSGYGYGSYGADGLFWGGLAGAIIGHNSGTFRHDAWRGAAWGAGVGWLLGSVADANRRAYPYTYPAAVQQAPAVQFQSAAPAQPQPVTIINNYYNAPATPMSAANGLFGRN